MRFIADLTHFHCTLDADTFKRFGHRRCGRCRLLSDIQCDRFRVQRGRLRTIDAPFGCHHTSQRFGHQKFKRNIKRTRIHFAHDTVGFGRSDR